VNITLKQKRKENEKIDNHGKTDRQIERKKER
jgi:hypothetical protein